MSYLGWPSLCLPAADLEASKRFYMMAGLELLSERPNVRAILGFGGFRLALMNFLDHPLINIRGGDVFAAQARLQGAFPHLDTEPNRYRREDVDADADGESWLAQDPDGFEVFFDTNDLERGDHGRETRTREILDGALQALAAIDANEDLLGELERLRASIPGDASTS